MKPVRIIGSLLAALIAIVGLTAVPASADGNGATQLDGVARAVTECGGETYDFALEVYEGNIIGCLVNTSFEFVETNGGMVIERGTETFIGCLHEDGAEVGCGSFDLEYMFTAKFAADGEQQNGRCQHPIVAGSGTGIFAGATGRFDFKDDLDAGVFNLRGHISLA